MVKLTREPNIIINWMLNELIPPVLRDQRWLMQPLSLIMFGEKSHHFMNFHKKCYEMTDAEFSETYRQITQVSIDRKTDLSQASFDRILDGVYGETYLEVGCGRGYLARRMSERGNMTACDIVVTDETRATSTKVNWQIGSVESLPFPDQSFDTVVTTHTLEHVRDLQKALQELRRVTRKRLIVVVPCERPHLYTFSLHINFFPYDYSIYSQFGKKPGAILEKVGGDWFYQEDVSL